MWFFERIECKKKNLIEPAHEIVVLITQATSEGSGETAQMCSLARAFAVRTQYESMKVGVQLKIRHLIPLDSCGCAFEFPVDNLRWTKITIISWAGSYDGCSVRTEQQRDSLACTPTQSGQWWVRTEQQRADQPAHPHSLISIFVVDCLVTVMGYTMLNFSPFITLLIITQFWVY